MLEICEKACNHALKLGAQHVEVFGVKSYGTSADIEGDKISFISQKYVSGIAIRIIRNGKIGLAYTSDMGLIEKTVEKALHVAKLSKKSDYVFPKSDGKMPKVDEIYDKKVLDLEESDIVKVCKNIIRSAKDVKRGVSVSGGGFSIEVSSSCIINTEGVCREEKSTYVSASAYTTYKKKDISTGFEFYEGRKLIDVDYIGSESAELAVRGQSPKKIDGGVMDVIFTPYAISQILEYTIVPAFYGDRVARGESILHGKLHKKFLGNVTIYDDGTYSGGINSSAFDEEGVFTLKKILCDDGTIKKFIYDSVSAYKYDGEITGNGLRVGTYGSSGDISSPPKTSATNIILDFKEKKESLLKEVDSGVLVYDVMGAHTSNPVSCEFSVNTSSIFKIENGDISYPIKSGMISGNAVELLKKIVAIGKDIRQISGGLTAINSIIPSVYVRDIRVTA